jgi:hypothetical protein
MLAWKSAWCHHHFANPKRSRLWPDDRDATTPPNPLFPPTNDGADLNVPPAIDDGCDCLPRGSGIPEEQENPNPLCQNPPLGANVGGPQNCWGSLVCVDPAKACKDGFCRGVGSGGGQGPGFAPVLSACIYNGVSDTYKICGSLVSNRMWCMCRRTLASDPYALTSCCCALCNLSRAVNCYCNRAPCR